MSDTKNDMKTETLILQSWRSLIERFLLSYREVVTVEKTHSREGFPLMVFGFLHLTYENNLLQHCLR